MEHKYLNELGVQAPSNMEHETWDLRFAFHCWLYERLMAYTEACQDKIDLEHHRITIGGEERTQGEWIKQLKENLRAALQKTYSTVQDEDEIALFASIPRIWCELLPYMWW